MNKARLFAAVILLMVLLFGGASIPSQAAGDQQTPPNSLPGSGGHGLPPLPPQWYQVQYDAHFNVESGIPIGAIALDQAGDGWMARGGTLWSLQSGKLTASNFSFGGTAIQSIALSSDGTQGWAIGFSTHFVGGPPPIVMLHYQNGVWSDASSTISAVGVALHLILDATATNGWAVGRIVTSTPHTTLLRLSNGVWSNASDLVPTGIVLNSIATDLSNQHTWAASLPSASEHHPSLYQMKDGKLVGGAVATSDCPIAAMTIDGNGNGWAVTACTNGGGPNAPLLRLHADGTSQPVANAAVDNTKVTMSQIAIDQNGNGWAFGSEPLFSNAPPVAVIEKVSGNDLIDWQYQGPRAMQGPQEQLIYGGMLNLAVSSSGAAWASDLNGTLLRVGDLPFSLPAPNPGFIYSAGGTPQCFANHECLEGVFLTYWQSHGGLRQFGLPITGPLLEKLDDGKIYTVQYTERARMEYHPQNQPPYTVELGLLGNKLVKGRENEAPFQPAKQIVDFYFPQTSHNLEGAIADYWMQNGALPVFGLPLSEAFMEQSPTDGKTYLVQYFERNRLEYHPENSDPQYKVLLGLLGVQQYQASYGTQP